MNRPAENYPDLEALQLQVWGNETNSRAPSSDRLIGNQTAETLQKWGAPSVAVTAAVLMPVLARGRRHLPPAKVFSPEAIDLAQRLADRRASLVLGPGAGGTGAAWLSSNLSRMYREAYLDLPDLSFTLLLLAHHDAVLCHDTALSQDDARLTQGVFAPFAEMLGLWSLYRGWVEKSYAVLFPDEYLDMKSLMGHPEDYTELSFLKMLATEGADRDPSQKNGNLIDKAAAFVSIKAKLEEKFVLKDVSARVEPIQNLTGLALRRVREKESREDVARRLGVRIICGSSDECYAALGILHSLGRPVSLSSILHFQDHIASPQPNGYRALQAAITYRGYNSTGGGSIVIECRIVTQQMLRINEFGVVAARPDGSELTTPSNAWWNQVPKLSAQLLKILNLDQGPTLPEYLIVRNAGSVSDPLYVFTPRGEIVLLPQSSTPLDFAYRIHSEMGHHALRIDVNGQSVPHGYPLRNGDIVRIHYDPDYAGPDISWLNLVATQSARTSIKRKLAARARAAHEGRAYVEAALLRALDRFQRGKAFNLSVTTDRLESFLRERASFYGYPDMTKFYASLAGNNQLTQRLVGDLVSSELTASIAGPEGEILPYALHQMRICQACLPAPGDPIVGCETQSTSGNKKVSIHRDGGQRCLSSVKDALTVNLAWSAESHIDQNELLVFSVTGDDRQRLLQDVLDAVYRTEEAYLYKVEATTFGDRQAVISLVVRADSFNRFADIETRLGNVAGVREIATAPPSPSQRATLVADPLHRQPPRQVAPPPENPYTSEEVYSRGIFYDRQDLLDILLEWLREPPPTQPMILHGQRRVGKTSLVMYLINEYLPAHRLAKPVFVTFQDLSSFEPQNVAGLIVRRVFREIRQSAPTQEDGEEPMEWLGRVLDEAIRYYPRLLVIIDEFNVLIDLERKAQTNSTVYSNLRALMSAQRSVNWLLVVQDTHFFDREMWRGAGVVFQKSRKHSVKNLDRSWARRLILEPARKCGIVPQNEEAIIDKVLSLTAGSPFLIHLICRELVDRVRRHHRKLITEADLKAATYVVTHEGERWFFHFMQHLTGVRDVVMAATTVAIGTNSNADESQVIKLVRDKAPEISMTTVRGTLVKLAQEGLISIHSEDEKRRRRISIHIGLFKIFLSDKMDVDKSVAQWRASLGQRHKAQRAVNDK